jgi:hypothetical protein
MTKRKAAELTNLATDDSDHAVLLPIEQVRERHIKRNKTQLARIENPT